MKKWLIYVLGIITGVILTFAYAFCINLSKNAGIIGLEMFEEPGECMEYSEFDVFQVVESGCALANAYNAYDTFDASTMFSSSSDAAEQSAADLFCSSSDAGIVLIIPDKKQHFYDDQRIVLKSGQCAQRVGTYKYPTKAGIEKTVPAIRIIDNVKSHRSDKTAAPANESAMTLFDKPGDCVSRKNFEVQKVLESGDAIALEIRDISNGGYVYTSDLKVLILAHERSNFYDKQIIRTPQGKCAKQIGNYKMFGEVIPIVDFK